MRTAEALAGLSHPWSVVGPLSAAAGRPCVVDDLPPGDVEILVLHARRSGRRHAVRLDPRRVARVRVPTETGPTLRGHLTEHGRPVAGARVSLHPLDAVRATARALLEHRRRIDSRPLASLSLPVERQLTDAEGGFELGRPEAGRPGHALVVERDGGRCRVLEIAPGTGEIRWELAEPATGP